MPQQQCPHCGRLGPRYDDHPRREGLTAADQRYLDRTQPGWDQAQGPPAWAHPHAEGSPACSRAARRMRGQED